MQRTTTIEIPERVATILRAMEEAGVFSVCNGKATLNFDAEGTLTQIETNFVSYKRGHPIHILAVDGRV